MPKVTKCMNGHFYDAERFDNCPYCASKADIGPTVAEVPPSFSGQVTVPVEPVGAGKPAGIGNPLENDFLDATKTVAKFASPTGKDPVVGWLICIEGKHYGEDYRLKAGNNFIGRDKTMDVVLEGDNSVSRIKHAIVTYDPLGNLFIVRPGESHELCYLNKQVLLEPKQLKIYDILSIGSSEMMFVPLVGQDFVWPEQK